MPLHYSVIKKKYSSYNNGLLLCNRLLTNTGSDEGAILDTAKFVVSCIFLCVVLFFATDL